MAPDHVQKKWLAKQLQYALSLKTLAGVRRFQKTILKKLEDETDTKSRSLTAGDITFDQVVEIFGLKAPVKLWEPREEIYDTPKSLTFNLAQLKKALYDKSSDAYSRIAIDYLIVACMVKHRDCLSRQSEIPTDQSRLPANDPIATTSPILEQSEPPTNDPYDQIATIIPVLDQARLPANDSTTATSPTLEQSEPLTNDPHNQTATIIPILDQATEIIGPSYITPDTPPKSTFQPLPIKVFPEMALSVQVKRGGREWHISGIADWAMGYGDRAKLEDGTVLLAVEAKRPNLLFNAEAQLLAYMATIRQLRIQAKKKNVMTQGFYSDGENYRFLCIRNNGIVLRSMLYEVSIHRRVLKSVFNFLLGMLTTAAESSPNTSPIKPGPEQDIRIGNLDQDVFVEVFEDIEVDNVSIPYEEGEEDEWSDVFIEEE